jgi:branched-chain amino acid aminotransferase
MNISITKADTKKVCPDSGKLGFGSYFSDHMFIMDFDNPNGWHAPRIVPNEKISLKPQAIIFHYGQGIFEGMKAFRTLQNKIVLFRPNEYLERFNRSAKILSIPQINLDLLYEGLTTLIQMDKDWIPADFGTSLYIRPFVISMDESLSVKAAEKYRLFIIMSPVGAYYSTGFNPVSIKVEEKYVRTVQGGIGEAKTPANYAASLRAQVEANKEGFAQVLWLDALQREYVEEVGTMNIFFKIKGEIITPALNGSILGGITRKTVIEQAANWGYPVIERGISIKEVYQAYNDGVLEEVFGTGTAAVISPVGELSWKGNRIIINDNQTGLLTQRLFQYIMDVQYGKKSDISKWNIEVD